MTTPLPSSPPRPAAPGGQRSRPLWNTYVAITALLLAIVIALAGGIIWYNSKKSNELAIAAAGPASKDWVSE